MNTIPSVKWAMFSGKLSKIKLSVKILIFIYFAIFITIRSFLSFCSWRESKP